MKDKATERPWKVVEPIKDCDNMRIFSGFRYIGSIGNSDDPPEITRRNTELIVQAVNAHDDLVKSLDDILEAMLRWNYCSDGDVGRLIEEIKKIARRAGPK